MTWTTQQLQAFLAAAAGHRLFPALWVLLATGMRRSELLGLRWTDIDMAKGAIKLNRGLVSVGYELYESRGKTANARRRIELDPMTIDLRHTHATLLIDAGVPVKVVSERLGHATAAFTIETYQHVLPSMQTRAADAVAQLMATPVEATRLKYRKKTA